MICRQLTGSGAGAKIYRWVRGLREFMGGRGLKSGFNQSRKCLMVMGLLASLVLEYSVPAIWGAPGVSSVQGSVADGQMVTITGSGFGATGPTVKVFDDFEGGNNGSAIAYGAGSATVSQWDFAGKDHITYSTDYPHGGTKSCKIDFDYIYMFPRLESQINVGPGQEVFFSWWQYMPVHTSVPGTNGPEGGGPNLKLFWLYGWDSYFRSDYVIVLLSNTLPSPYSQFVAADDPNGRNLWGGRGEYPDIFRKGVWTRYWLWFKGGASSDGAAGVWQMNATGGFKTIATGRNITNQTSGKPWRYIHFPGFGRKDSSSVFYLDDIYVATGAARARVEIGEKPKYSSCTNLVITTPVSWSDGQIKTIIRQGGFRSGDKAYLFVIDANGNVSSKGWPMRISSGEMGASIPPRNHR